MNEYTKQPTPIEIRTLETMSEMEMVEGLCLQVWPGSEIDIIPAHLLLTMAKNGGIVLGAFDAGRLVGFVFGFVGFRDPEGELMLKHCSHQLGVHPDYRNQGIGFKLKRAQWQLARRQGLELITWTFDPLLSLNAYLNVTRLGAVANTYFRELYGEMRDGLNAGLPSDRLQVDWWVNSKRVAKRLSSTPRLPLDLAHFLAADVPQYNRTRLDSKDHPVPEEESIAIEELRVSPPPVLLFEIPADFSALKLDDIQLAALWRRHSRTALEALFSAGYFVTDFVFLSGKNPRSFYVLSYGDTTLGVES